MKDRNLEHSDNWSTPPHIYAQLDHEFNFDFDPCPLNKGVITPDKDGLLIDWGDRNFINPPYSKELKEAFVRRALNESRKGKLCVLLIPSSTSTKLFHDVIIPNAKEIRFVKGRIKFIGTNSNGEVTDSGTPMHDSMIVVFDGRNKKHKGFIFGSQVQMF